MNVQFTLKSRNARTGPIPVTTSSMATCSDACPFKAAGCYAVAAGPLAILWRDVSAGKKGGTFADLIASVSALPMGTLWRHNQAGDLAGVGDTIDHDALRALAAANTGKCGFTYTHKPMTADNQAAVLGANKAGFTVNLSANTLAHADTLAELAIGPVVVVQDAEDGERADTTTPAGRKVVTCPATYRDGITCKTYKLCQVYDRKVIVGFPAHGKTKQAARAIAAA